MAQKRSPVLELQQLASDRATEVSVLLRKALVIAAKLGLEDFRAWIENELKGYPQNDQVPDYRRIQATIRAKNPYHGLIPVVFADQRIADALTEIPLGSPIGGLEQLMSKNDETEGHLEVPLSAQQEAVLHRIDTEGPQLPITRFFGRNQVASILEIVRTTILEWALQLESQGILGEEMTFTEEEKQQATQNPHIQIHNFQGILGDVSQSSVSQQLTTTVQAGDLGSLRAFLASQGLEQTDLDGLEACIKEDPRPQSASNLGPLVAGWIGQMVQKAAQGAWRVAVATAAGVLAKAICAYYGI